VYSYKGNSKWAEMGRLGGNLREFKINKKNKTRR